MRISYHWLQTFFEQNLPPAERVAELLTMHAFEVESLEPVTTAHRQGGANMVGQAHTSSADWIFDIKILPNRTHDCLSHRGIARELASLLNLQLSEEFGHLMSKFGKSQLPRVVVGKPQRSLTVDVPESKLCRRYIGRVIENIEVRQSPEWLRDALTTVGQKSINNVVDAANFVMLHIGQPTHAFDADRVAGENKQATIIVRRANEGEQMTTLSDQGLTFSDNELLITNGERSLALAGIKGGKHDFVNEQTTNLILEVANFEPINIRRTSQKLGIRTDSSQRYENDLAPELCSEGVELLTKLILAIAKTEKTKVGPVTDFYPRSRKPYLVGFRTADVRNILGVEISDKEIGELLTRLHLPWKKVAPLDSVLKLAPKLTGLPYRYGAQISYDAPEFFDCSSLTGYLFAQAGIAIPRMTIDQYFFGYPVDTKDLAAGDIVFSNTHTGGNVYFYSQEYMSGRKIKEGIDHCGLYLGNGKIMHTSRHVKNVQTTIEKLKDNHLFKDMVGIRRMVGDSDERYVVTVPVLRLDLRRKEDVIEEIGRLYGFDRLPAVQPVEAVQAPEPNAAVALAGKIREVLVGAGFSEVYLYTLGAEGELELTNPLAADRKFLRSSLLSGIKKALEENLKYQDEVKIFEIGHTFRTPETGEPETRESKLLALGIATKRKLKPGEIFYETKGVVELLARTLHITITFDDDFSIWADTSTAKQKIGWCSTDGLAELDLDSLETIVPARVQYQPIVRYPSITRDIAMFVPSETKVGDALTTIIVHAGPLLTHAALFDTFEKEGKKSLAFRLVFQSRDRTLLDAEVNDFMQAVSQALQTNGWTVR